MVAWMYVIIFSTDCYKFRLISMMLMTILMFYKYSYEHLFPFIHYQESHVLSIYLGDLPKSLWILTSIKNRNGSNKCYRLWNDFHFSGAKVLFQVKKIQFRYSILFVNFTVSLLYFKWKGFDILWWCKDKLAPFHSIMIIVNNQQS